MWGWESSASTTLQDCWLAEYYWDEAHGGAPDLAKHRAQRHGEASESDAKVAGRLSWLREG